MKAIEGDGCAATWLAAVQHLLTCEDWEQHNLFLEIRKPCVVSVEDKRIIETVDAFLRKQDANPLFTVAETIFPAAEYRANGVAGVYKNYPDVIYPAIKSELGWGSYAYRLLRQTRNGESINPLSDTIEKMKSCLASPSTMRLCYEISLSEGAFDLRLYDTDHDAGYRRGGPCLSHVSLKISRRRELYLTATYRAHYYIERALGNFIGLSRLQAFICEQTGLTPGPLACASTFAKLDTDRWNRGPVTDLVCSLVHDSSAGAPQNQRPTAR